MTTKKDLNKKSKKELVNLLYDFQSLFFTLERIISHDIYEDVLQEMYFEALDGKIPQSEFFSAARFANKFDNLVKEKVQELARWEPVKIIMDDDRFDFGNWYTSIDIFRKEETE